jgi:hypothetical protein
VSVPGTRLVLAAASVAAVLLAAREARAQPPSARSELEQGYELRKRGNYVDALPHLLESYRLDAQLKTLINLADAEEHVGKLVDARRHWDEARAQAAREGEAEIEAESRRRVAALESRIPSLTVKLASGSVLTVRIDEDGLPFSSGSIGAPVPTDPGHHTLVVHADGYEDRSFDVILQAGVSVEFSVTPGPPKPATPSTAERSDGGAPSPALRLTGAVAAGVGAVGLGVGTYFGIAAIQKQQDANCPRNVCTAPSGHPDTLRQAIDAGNLSTVFLVAGGVLVAGGAALWFLAPRGGEPRAAIAPVVVRDGAGASLVARW